MVERPGQLGDLIRSVNLEPGRKISLALGNILHARLDDLHGMDDGPGEDSCQDEGQYQDGGARNNHQENAFTDLGVGSYLIHGKHHVGLFRRLGHRREEDLERLIGKTRHLLVFRWISQGKFGEGLDIQFVSTGLVLLAQHLEIAAVGHENRRQTHVLVGLHELIQLRIDDANIIELDRSFDGVRHEDGYSTVADDHGLIAGRRELPGGDDHKSENGHECRGHVPRREFSLDAKHVPEGHSSPHSEVIWE